VIRIPIQGGLKKNTENPLLKTGGDAPTLRKSQITGERMYTGRKEKEDCEKEEMTDSLKSCKKTTGNAFGMELDVLTRKQGSALGGGKGSTLGSLGSKKTET